MKGMIVAASLCMAFTGAAAQTRIIAHRGYWDSEGSAQNSIASLKKAVEAQLYGSEFDVLLTKDYNVLVNHDDSINGLRIADATYDQLKDIRLGNGERIPTLDDYLQEGKALPQIQLILEIKPHGTKAEEDSAVCIVVRRVREMEMEKQVEYISFSMNICEQLARLTPDSHIAYLGSDVAPNELKDKGINGIDYYYEAFEMKPEWVEEAHRLGMKVNVWTVNDTKMIQRMLDLKVDFITTDHPVEARRMSMSQK